MVTDNCGLKKSQRIPRKTDKKYNPYPMVILLKRAP